MSFWNGHHWGADTPPTADVKLEGRAKHVAKALLEAGLVTALAFGLIAGSTFAAKGGGASTIGGGRHGGGSTGGTLSVIMLSDRGTAGLSWGDYVTYDVSKAGVANPFITTTCVQGGATVLTQFAGYYDTYMWPAAKNITLSSEAWTGGAATCTAVVSNSTVKLVYGVAG